MELFFESNALEIKGLRFVGIHIKWKATHLQRIKSSMLAKYSHCTGNAHLKIFKGEEMSEPGYHTQYLTFWLQFQSCPRS